MIMTLTQVADNFVHSPQLHFIGGKKAPSQNKATQEVFDPSTGAVLTTVAIGETNEVNEAVVAAEAAYPDWSKMLPLDRAVLLHRLADLLEKHSVDLAQIESLDVGKAVVNTQNFDIPFGIACLRYYADLLQHLSIDTPHALPNIEARTHRVSYGVCGFIFPWNFPFDLLLWNIVPALAAGNTIVVKPSELAPLSTLFVASLASEAEIPGGVINVVVGGATAGQALAEHPGIRRMSFTGSPRVGKVVGEICGRNLVPVKLELGGKGAAVIFDDVDLDHVAKRLSEAITFNTGQVCCTATRWLFHQNIYDKLLCRVVDELNKVRIGPALDRETRMGPLVSEAHFNRVQNHLEKGKTQGATWLMEPKAPKPSDFEGGYYVSPSLLTGDPSNVCCREEIFGPSAFVLKFSDEGEAIHQVNSLNYGLANSVWSADLQRAYRVAERMVAGNSWINAHNVFAYGLPYRAVNLSGLGGGVNSYDTLLDYLRPQTIARPLV